MNILKTVYLWHNDIVMTFGADGEQIPELQGRITIELAEALRAASDNGTAWFIGIWGIGFAQVSIENWGYEASRRIDPSVGKPLPLIWGKVARTEETP